MTPATSAPLPIPADWRKAAQPAGVATVRWDTLPGCVRVELDQDAADVIGWPSHVVVELTALVMSVHPCNAGDVGARSTWDTRAGGLAFTARVAIKKRTLGRWPAWQHGAGLVLDLAGPDQARAAA